MPFGPLRRDRRAPSARAIQHSGQRDLAARYNPADQAVSTRVGSPLGWRERRRERTAHGGDLVSKRWRGARHPAMIWHPSPPGRRAPTTSNFEDHPAPGKSRAADQRPPERHHRDATPARPPPGSRRTNPERRPKRLSPPEAPDAIDRPATAGPPRGRVARNRVPLHCLSGARDRRAMQDTSGRLLDESPVLQAKRFSIGRD